jgi:phosphonate transport system ATP-binding protein
MTAAGHITPRIADHNATDAGAGHGGGAGVAPQLDVRGLTVHRGAHPALRDVSFQVQPGEFVAVLGRSGAGKTTLLHALAGLLRAAAGRICWGPAPAPACRAQIDGQPCACAQGLIPAPLGARVNGADPVAPRAMLFQHYRLVPQLSALHNVVCGRLGEYPWWRTLAGLPAREKTRAEHWLSAVGLAGHARQRAHRLSGGEQQRVAIARALNQEPAVLLADEPVASLDAESAAEMMRLFAALNRHHGMTLLCVLHDLEMAEQFAGRVLLLDGGALAYDGPSRNLQRVVKEALQWKALM